MSDFIRDDAEALIQYGSSGSSAETGTAREPFCTPQNEEDGMLIESRQVAHDEHCAALIIFLSDWSGL